MIARIDSRWRSAAKRAVRTFIVAAAAVPLGVWLASATVGTPGVIQPTITSLVDAVRDTWDLAVGTGVLAALGTFGWRGVLDPSRIPSLNDAPKDAAGPPA